MSLVVIFVTMIMCLLIADISAAGASYKISNSDIAGKILEGHDTEVGDVITYQISVTNNGTEAITEIMLKNWRTKEIIRPDDRSGVLNPGETWIYTTKHVVSQLDIDRAANRNESIEDVAILTCRELPYTYIVTRFQVIRPVDRAGYVWIDSGFLPNRNGLSYDNFGSVNYSEAEFHNIFGYYVNNSRETSEFYEKMFRLNSGNCLGVCAVSLEFYSQGISAYDFKNYRMVSDKWKGFVPVGYDYSPNTVLKWIKYRQASVWNEAVKKDLATGGSSNYDKLKAHMSSPDWKENPMIICFGLTVDCISFGNKTIEVQKTFMPSALYSLVGIKFERSGSAHAVVPYSIEESSDHKSAKIAIYDPNYPGLEFHQYMNIDLVNGKVSVDGYTGVNSMSLVSLESIKETPKLSNFVHISNE